MNSLESGEKKNNNQQKKNINIIDRKVIVKDTSISNLFIEHCTIRTCEKVTVVVKIMHDIENGRFP